MTAIRRVGALVRSLRPPALPLALLLALGLTVGPLVPADASADGFRIRLGDSSTPAPGRLLVEVITDAPYVAPTLSESPTSYYGVDSRPVSVPKGGRVVLDLDTWGAPEDAWLSVRPCVSPSDCAYDGASGSVATQDVAPAVEFPDDTLIGPADPPYAVTVDDSHGAGTLVLAYSDRSLGWPEVARAGTTVVDLPNGRYHLRLLRCSLRRTMCRFLGVRSRDLVVDRAVEGSVSTPVSQVGPQPLPLTLQLAPGVSPVDVTLVVRDQGGRVVPVVDGHRPDAQPDERGAFATTLDLTGVPSGTYDVSADVVYDDPDVGQVTGSLTPTRFTLDATAPRILSVRSSDTSIYPFRDSYRDSVRLTTRVAGVDASTALVRHDVVDRRGRVVAAFEGPPGPLGWDGRSSTGRAVPAGRYSMLTVVTDRFGNVARGPRLTIAVSAKGLRQHVYTRTVTAAASLTGRNVGRCSTLKVGSVRGWRGGMSLRTATRCRGTVRDTFVSTGHGLIAPAAFRYQSVDVMVIGGASRDVPGSQAFVSYLRRLGGYDGDTLLTSEIRSHRGEYVRGDTHVFDDGYVGWSVYTAAGSHYDVKGFTVRIRYTRLE